MSMAARLWRLSCSLHRRQYRRSARLVKTLNFFLFHCLLPPEADLGRNVQLCHHGLGVVIHPNVSIGNNVRIFHNVTIAGTTWIDSPHRVRIDDDVLIGVGAVILPRTDQGLRIGRGAVVGAGAVVTHDVPPKATVVGVPARTITGEDESQTAKIKPASSASGPVQ